MAQPILGTQSVLTILTAVRGLLNDSASQATPRWSETTLTTYFNDGAREIARHKPDAYNVRQPVKLKPGQVFQSGILPNDTIQLIDITRNMGVDGTVQGDAIMPALLKDFQVNRSWHRAPPKPTIENWIPADPDKLSFWVYPPPALTVPVFVEAFYSEIPPAVAADTDISPIRDIYITPLQMFIAGRALLQDIEQGQVPRGNAYLGAFYLSIGVAPPGGAGQAAAA